MLICSRFPGPEENYDQMMGGKFKKDIMRMIKKGTQGDNKKGGVGVGTQRKLYDLGKKGKEMAGYGEEDSQEGAGRSRLSAHFQKAMKQ